MPETEARIDAGNFQQYTDKYFLRSRHILEAEGINPYVRYQMFARSDGILNGIDEAIGFIRDVAGSKAAIYALRDGDAYRNCEPFMKLEGRVQDLVELETVYLGIVAGALTGRIDMDEVSRKAKAIYKAAEGKPVIYFGARHFHYSLDGEIAARCKDAGFVGCSTDIGAKAWNADGSGTIPHALILSYAINLQEQGKEGNPTVEAAKGFDRHIDDKVGRIVLIDTFNREITDSLETADALPNLRAVRIDTCGENYAQGSREVELPELDVAEKYLNGKGVSIAAVWALRKAFLDNGHPGLEVVVSSGFNAEKTAAFIGADKAFNQMYGLPLFHYIGTGSISSPKMTTSDIVAYRQEDSGLWLSFSKKGRDEIRNDSLKQL